MILDYRSPTCPTLECPYCKASEPLPLPLTVSAISAIVRDAQFRHAACRQSRTAVKLSYTQPSCQTSSATT